MGGGGRGLKTRSGGGSDVVLFRLLVQYVRVKLHTVIYYVVYFQVLEVESMELQGDA